MKDDKNYFNGQTMHIDISKIFNQKGDSGIAFKIIPSKKHKGIVISNKLKKELIRGFKLDEDYNKLYSSKFITSLSKLREISGDHKIRSYADNIANIYRKKALKPNRRQQKGVKLNFVEINYKKIKEKLEE